MTKQEIINQIENNHLLLYVPQVSKIYDGNLIHFGHFHTFEDSAELKKEGKYRFVTITEQQLFIAEQSRHGKSNTKYSIIINVGDIVKMEIVDGRTRS